MVDWNVVLSALGWIAAGYIAYLVVSAIVVAIAMWAVFTAYFKK